jgi:hypothetical protein
MEIFSKKLLILLLFLQVSCSNNPVISELTNDRMTIILKSTYASGTDYGWYNFHESDSYSDTTSLITFSDGGLPAGYADAKFYFDFAELRLATGTGKPSGTLPEDYWEYPAQKRLLFCSDNIALFSRELLTCKDQKGSDQLASLFDSGITLASEDIKSGNYPHLGMFFRKLVTYPAKIYSNATYSAERTTTFDNRQILGLDVEPYYQQTPGSISTIPLLFPLERTDFNLQIPTTNKAYVLEVRVLLKNAIMKHVIKEGSFFSLSSSSGTASVAVSNSTVTGTNTLFTTDFQVGDDLLVTGDFNGDGTETSETKTVTVITNDTTITVDSNFSGNITATATLGTRYSYLAFLGPSDIVNNHNYTNSTQATQLGGNLLFTARVYEPDGVGSIEISNSGTVNANTDYYAAVPAGETFDPASSPGLPYAAVAANVTGVTPKIGNLPAGSYDLYVVCDKKKNNGSGPDSVTGTDGYPETKASCATGVAVTVGSTTQSNGLNCTCP